MQTPIPDPGHEFDRNTMDISSALRGWHFQPGQVNVRLIRGNDGKPKLQLRLDLGLLQMELNGRPDGRRPHRNATELEYHTRKLQRHMRHRGTDQGFVLNATECQALREESAMFYHRYLSLFVLEQYEAVIRDTQHNLSVLDMCSKYGRNEYDRMCLEQYRPYIIMMNTRAKACEALRSNYVQTALAYLRGGVRQILRLMPKEQRRQMLRQSNEVRILLDMVRQIRMQLPPDPRDSLRSRLKEALAAEHYEEAARLRDQLTMLEHSLAEQARALAAQGAARNQPKAALSESAGADNLSGLPAAENPNAQLKPAPKRRSRRQKPFDDKPLSD